MLSFLEITAVLSFLTLSTISSPKIVFFRSNMLVFMLPLTSLNEGHLDLLLVNENTAKFTLILVLEPYIFKVFCNIII